MMRELAIQIISGLVGGMVAVVFANFMLLMVRHLKDSKDRDPWAW